MSTSDYGEVIIKLSIEESEASFAKDSFWINIRSLATPLNFTSLAAGVWDSTILEEGHVFPISIILDSTAVQVLLDQVPGGGHALVALSPVVT